ncbi:MAG: glmZ(sRNA)-inactivating NTPase [Acidobacteria bacterium ADurb.Bin340]|nr:MAG: glmZ(sRNA)-inactivating NTPase [Acidobacteria bacterium ADurb.Bin340]
MDLILVTGLSGAGRRSVLSALEDSGAATLDSVPPELVEPLLGLQSQLTPTTASLAVGLDNRQADFATRLLPVLDRLQGSSQPCKVVFVEAQPQVLVRRYSETRRPHFLAQGGNLLKAVELEQKLLEPIRRRADAVLDTSGLTLAQLKQRVENLLPGKPHPETVLRILSFGFKHGLPQDADMVLDARCLPNPHYDPQLRPLDGRDPPVIEFLEAQPEVMRMLADIRQFIKNWLPSYVSDSRAYLTVAIGCTGGQHRSVALVELLAEELKADIPGLVVQHRELA